MLKTEVENLYKEFVEISKIVEKTKKQLQEESKDVAQKYPTADNTEELERQLAKMRVTSMFYDVKQGIAMSRFFFVTELAVKEGIELPENINSLYKERKKEMNDNEILTRKGEALVEVEKGMLESKVSQFLESKEFNYLKTQLEQQLKSK